TASTPMEPNKALVKDEEADSVDVHLYKLMIGMNKNETVYKEWEDRMERAATTASSLDAEQDIDNINRIQSMATLNESFP
ncbi:hypothetical protein Tco_0709367, partial [Tanacetum coccineum]